MQALLRDIRYALRGLARSPGFTLAAVLSLALGIGANTAVFTLVDRVLMKPLPVPHPEKLVLVTSLRPDGPNTSFAYPFYTALRDSRNAGAVFNALIARTAMPVNSVAGGRVLRLRGELVSGNYFDALGVKPMLGRAFRPEEDRTPGTHPVAVISYGFWQRAFELAPDILGTKIQINNASYTVIGVAAKEFNGTDIGSPVDAWVPMMMQAQLGRDHLSDLRTNWLEIIGRLKDGVAREQAEAAVSLESLRYARTAQSRPGILTQVKLVAADKGHSPLRNEVATAFTILLAITWLGILLACSNVGNLLLARSALRAREVSVRIALGAGRVRLARQFLVESLTLALLGGCAAVAVTPWAAGVLAAFQSERLTIDTRIDVRVLAYVLSASLVAGIVLGLIPIFALRGVSFLDAWRSDRSVFRGRIARFQLRDALVVVQVAVSVVMLISAGLLLQSLAGLRSVNPGFRVDNLLLVSLDPASAGYDGARLRAFWDDVVQRIRALPGTQSATLAKTAPLAPGRQRQPVRADGFTVGSAESLEIDSNFVGPDYFRTLEIPVLRGRDFDRSDRMDSPHVVIVNEGVARLIWPNQNPLGKTLRVGGREAPPLEVVAVVQDARYRNLRDEPLPMVYRPIQQTESSDMMTLHVRAAGPGTLARAIREEIRAVAPNLPFDLTTFEQQLDSSLGQTRQAAALSGGFGFLALILAAIGVYGVTAFAVSTRTRDIGIRLALGASPSHVGATIARRALSLLLAGVMLGVASAYSVARIFAPLLFGVGSNDPVTFVGAALLLALVSCGAMYVPVRGAIRLDPLVAIRHE